MKFAYIITLVIFITGCARESNERLGDGYRYYDPSSFTGMIMKKEKIIVPRIVIDYAYDNDYIVAVQMPGIEYMCPVKSMPGAQTRTTYHENKIIYIVIDKNNGSKKIISTIEDLAAYLKEIGFNAEFNSTQTKWADIMRRVLEYNEDLDYLNKSCTLAPIKYD
jgi:hypothetical protein